MFLTPILGILNLHTKDISFRKNECHKWITYVEMIYVANRWHYVDQIS